MAKTEKIALKVSFTVPFPAEVDYEEGRVREVLEQALETEVEIGCLYRLPSADTVAETEDI